MGGPLIVTVRGTLMIRGPLTVGRVPDSQRGSDDQRAPEALMLRGPLIFRRPLTVGRAPDSQRAPDDQKGPDIQKVY